MRETDAGTMSLLVEGGEERRERQMLAFGSIGGGWRGEMRDTDADTLSLLLEGGEER